MKFMAIGRHPDVPDDSGRDLRDTVLGNLEFFRRGRADGTIDSVHVMKGGGRIVIASADDEASLREYLAQPPDHPLRTWEIVELVDFDEAMTKYLSDTTEP
jgi:hypothetical protein